MKKRMTAALLAVSLLLGSWSISTAYAANTQVGVQQTIQALGIMIGDQNGNMQLSRSVTRAEFAKMAVAASAYHDTIGQDGAGYSLFKDVKNSHWASEYIKIAVDEKWMVGYTNGTFRPDQAITLEEGCTIALRLLGYDSSDLAGSFPAAQLNKASALGLRDQISCGRGEKLTRQECMYLFYNLMTTETKEGKVYAETLGYTVNNGELDYAAIVEKSLSGPYTSDGSQPRLSFTPSAVYRDGDASSLSAISQYDIYYYSENMRAVWIYTDRVTGTVSAISPSVTAPTAVTVSGKEYKIGTTTAAYKLSALGGGGTDQTVMLLLGMDGSVADVVTGNQIDTVYYGVVQSAEKQASTASSNATMKTKVELACTDGSIHTFVLDQESSYDKGDLLSIRVTSSATTAKALTTSRLSGKVNSKGTSLGEYDFAQDVEILDTNTDGYYAKVKGSRLAGVNLSSSDIRFYALDENGDISHLILKDVTGDIWTYGMLRSVKGLNDDAADGIRQITYTYLIQGETKIWSTSADYSLKGGGLAVRYDENGNVATMKSTDSVTVSNLFTTYVTGKNGKKYNMAEDVQVYLRGEQGYYLTTLSAINDEDYTLTAYYDDFGCTAGGRVRVLLAEKN